MSSPRCTLNRWGTGGNTGGTGGNTGGSGSCNSTPKTEEAKEIELKLKKMMEERNKLDNIWTQPVEQKNYSNNGK